MEQRQKRRRPRIRQAPARHERCMHDNKLVASHGMPSLERCYYYYSYSVWALRFLSFWLSGVSVVVFAEDDDEENQDDNSDNNDENEKEENDDDDNSNNQNQNYNNNQNNQNYNNNSNKKNSSNSNSYKGYLDVQTFCRKQYVSVSVLYLTCDSPGAYYYGSNTYRDSTVCVTNDKASIKMKLTISDALSQDETIYMTIASGLVDNFATVVKPTPLCNMQITATDGSGASCPSPGTYHLQTYYTVPDLISDYEAFHYTPDVKITFLDGNNNRIGCAATGTAAMREKAKAKGRRGSAALGAATVVFCIVFGVLLYCSYWRRKRMEKMAERQTVRYQYFCTLPNGHVVPYAGRQQQQQASSPHGSAAGSVQQQQHLAALQQQQMTYANTDALDISNPAYNETHLPTRPVI